MLKYLDKAENEINTAEPVNIEPDTLAVQLKDHQVNIIKIRTCYMVNIRQIWTFVEVDM